jgi:hypothetical protein
MIRRSAFFLISIFLIIGCTAPLLVREKAATVLGPHCYAFFTNSAWDGYQRNAQHHGKLALAYAQDYPGGPEACEGASLLQLTDGYLTNKTTMEDVKNAAIAGCEKNKLNTGIKAPCKIFAIGNEIVWDKSEDIKLQ